MRIVLLLFFLLTGCASRGAQLASLYLVDNNGFSQTISQAQRLQQYERVDFLKEQPYRKVMRTWRDRSGQSRAILTSYYPSGRIMQYLEGYCGKASGEYREWHENGQLRVEVHLSGGKLDFGDAAEQSWIFEGDSIAYDEQGRIQARIPYSHGKKEGVARLYHPTGQLWQEVSYRENLIDGAFCSWYPSGEVLVRSQYRQGELEGFSLRYWPGQRLAAQERYEKGFLVEASYWDLQGQLLASVVAGQGERVLFGRYGPIERQTIAGGRVEGRVSYYDEQGRLLHELQLYQGVKEGEELYYYPNDSSLLNQNQQISPIERPLRPKLAIEWHDGVMQGGVRSWYPSGQLESERHIMQEQLTGPYIAYYPNGQLRMVEEYRAGLLVSGEYFELGASQPTSCVRQGEGRALIYSESGQLEQELFYHGGQPAELANPIAGVPSD